MSTIYRIIAIGFISLIIGIGTNQLINQGIRWPILLLVLSKTEEPVDLIYIPVDTARYLLLQKGAFFVDIRPKDEFEIDHIPGSFSLPFYQYFGQKNLLKTMDKNKTIILYCFEPINKKVELLAKQLLKEGFKQTRILQGGFAAWLENRYPLETGKSL
ncbi:rhodanese-like domain-containing protein [bacterium]|nr:rhodanese-like domain-containing protein [bacterium]